MTTAVRVSEAADWPPDIQALVDGVRAEWPAVDKVWADLTRDRGDIHLLRQAGKDPRDFLAAAFTIADDRGLLREFALRLVRENLLAEGQEQKFDDVLQTLLGRSPFEFQVFTNGVFNSVNALRAFQDGLRACDLVCRIDIDGAQKGTGFLVRQNLVATAAHVVEELLARTQSGALALSDNGSLVAAPDSLRRLTVTFKDFDRSIAAPDGVAVGRPAILHHDWLAWGSPRSATERLGSLTQLQDIGGIASPDGPWDLALIRLAEPMRLEPPELLAQPPAAPFWVHLLHHPHGVQRKGEPLLWSTGTLDQGLGQPPVRYLHDANTLQGSSGAPVFNEDWHVVALHQGGLRNLDRAEDAPRLAPTARNRAVPVRYWRDTLDLVAQRDDVPYVWTLTDQPDTQPYPYPVIGRRETQRRLWRGIQDGAMPTDRLLIVRGTPGTGRRFTKRLGRAMIEKHGGVFVSLDLANAASDDAATFAERVAGALSAPMAHPSADEALTTEPREVRQRVAPALYRAWETLAVHRPVWLHLAVPEVLSRPVADLIDGLIRRLPEQPHLRLVLVGWGDPAPPGFEASVEFLTPPTALDIAYHLTPPGTQPERRHVDAAQSVLVLSDLSGYEAAHEVLARLGPRVAAAVASEASA